MSSGLIALLDDVAGLAKLAAASLDDAAAQAGKAGGKAMGIVIDDAAVTPRYVVGLAPERELPVIRAIALGSLRNKMLVLLPAALLLSWLAPWLVTPLLMAGGAFLCLEGWHKVADLLWPGRSHGDPGADVAPPETPEALEAAKIASAIRTDFILSAEIMAITLATVSDAAWGVRAAVLALVGLLMTIGVYGAVALIVKADDAGYAWSRSGNRLLAGCGRALVAGMPGFLAALGTLGMLAMLWVGGGILVHGAHVLGWTAPETALHALSQGAAGLAGPVLGGTAGWLAGATASAIVGLVIGALVDPLARFAIAPAWRRARGLFARRA